MRNLKFGTVQSDTLYGIEEKPNEFIELGIFNFTKRKVQSVTPILYLPFPFLQLSLHNNVKLTQIKEEIQLKCSDLSPDESLWVFGLSDGTILLYSIMPIVVIIWS